MKIDKAIEILDTHQCDMPRDKVPDLIAAINLGIEALKARKVWQDNEGFDPDEALPGETEN